MGNQCIVIEVWHDQHRCPHATDGEKACPSLGQLEKLCVVFWKDVKPM